jgi:Skp family chaperone for outer membrane proteins
MTRFYKVLIAASLLMSVGTLIVLLMVVTQTNKTFYVNNGKLYESFKLTKESEEKVKNLRLQRKNMLDSIGFTLKQLEAQNKVEEFNYVKDYYLDKIKKFEEEESVLIEEYNKQIWERLNQYAKEYSEQKNIKLLLGASGDGNLLHADSELDKTKELVDYSNLKYAGK